MLALPASRLSEAQWRDVLRLEATAWPRTDPTRRGPDPAMQPVAMLLQVDGTAVASLFVLTKEIRHAGAPYRASGLRAVVTDPGHRGKGYGLRLVRAAHDLVRDRGDDLMLFTCDPELVPFYEAAGSRVLPGTVVLGGTPEQPVRSDDFGKVTLAALFSEQARSAAASFEQSEIALHPGARETLW